MKNLTFITTLALALLLPEWARAQDGAADAGFVSDESHSGSLEHEYIQDGKTGNTLNALTTLALSNKWSFGQERTFLSLTANGRFWVDSDNKDTMDGDLHDNVEKLIAFAQIPFESFQLQIGQQELTWGENLLMPVLDVVNQRDVNHPRGYYDPAAKRPAQMINAEWTSDLFNMQLVYIPKPEVLKQPDEVAGFKVKKDPVTGRTAEYGGRAGLYVLGLDAKLYHFRHWARIPAYEFLAFSGSGDLKQAEKFSATNGFSFSYAGYNWLLRGDFARHNDFPATNIGTSVEWSSLTQSILGLQLTSESQQSISFEWHQDHWDQEPVAWKDGAFVDQDAVDRDLSWIVVSSNLSFFSGKFEPFLLAMRGVEKSDKLVRLIPVWNVRENLTLAVEYQKTESESRSPKLLLDNRETLSFRAAWSF